MATIQHMRKALYNEKNLWENQLRSKEARVGRAGGVREEKSKISQGDERKLKREPRISKQRRGVM